MGHGQTKSLIHDLLGLKRHDAEYLLAGIFPEYAGRLTVFIKVYGAAVNGLCASVYAGYLKGPAVCCQYVSAGSLKDQGIVRAHVIQILSYQHSILICKIILVPSHPVKHGAGLRMVLFYEGPYPALDLCDTVRAKELNACKIISHALKMLMGIIEAGNHRASLGIVSPGLRRRCSQYAFI